MKRLSPIFARRAAEDDVSTFDMSSKDDDLRRLSGASASFASAPGAAPRQEPAAAGTPTADQTG